MDRFGPGPSRRIEDRIDVQVRLVGGHTRKMDRLVGNGNVPGLRIDIGMDRHE
jgi:hypothetical protein